MPICVYCCENLSAVHFNTEHVLPEQLGTFDEKNLTLTEQVCRGCNSFFGQTIERAFGRDSLEAIFRLTHGQKSPKRMGKSSSERFVLRIPEPSRWAGAIVLLASDHNGQLIVTLTPQVGVRRRLMLGFEYFTEEQIAREPALLTGIGKADIKLIAQEPDKERLVELVRSRCPGFTVHGTGSIVDQDLDIKDGKVLIEMRARVDRTIARTAAKIVFNYLTYWMGADFVLDRSFDLIRRFIRSDEGEWRDFVRVTTEPILAQETASFRETDGHVLTINWRETRTLRHLRSRALVVPLPSNVLQGQFSPYNHLNYRVTLTAKYTGIWRDIRYGNVFDWRERKILDMLAPRIVPLDPKRAARAAEALMPRGR